MTNGMKVALVIERLESWRGGAETSTALFAGHLTYLGCEVHVVTTTNMPSTPDMKILPIKASGALRAARTHLFAQRAARYLASKDYNIVHAITPCMAADIYQPRGGTVPETLQRNVAIRAGHRSRGLKRIGQQLNLKYRIIAHLERRMLTRNPAPWVISISDYVTEQLQRHYGFDPSRIRKIFNGVDSDPTPPADRAQQRAEVRAQYRLKDDDLLLLCVAHNFKLKGVHRLIEALARVRYGGPSSNTPPARGGRFFAIVVGRDNPRAFARLAEQKHVEDRVIFAGPTQRIPGFYHAADVLVHPTYYDPCSRVVLEALAAGVPVITTRFNGAAERIVDGREGYVIESPDDVPALASAITALCDNDHRRACAAAALKATKGITMREHAKQAMKLYEELIDSGTLRRGAYR